MTKLLSKIMTCILGKMVDSFFMKITAITLFIFQSINIYSQVFLVRPNGDTTFYNSQHFKLDRTRSVYSFSVDFYDNKTKSYLYCIKKLTIIQINKIQNNYYKKSNLYNNYIFDSYLDVKIAFKNCFYISIDSIYRIGNILAQTLVIQFDKKLDTVLFKNRYNFFTRNDTIFDLGKRKVFFKNVEFDIESFGGMEIIFKDSSCYSIYIINIRIVEGEMEGFYVVVDKGKIRSIYKYHYLTDERYP